MRVTDEQLKPCPFCGGEAEHLELTDEANFGGSVIVCKKCGASSPVHFDRKENLYDSWNQRAALEAALAVEGTEAKPVALGMPPGLDPMNGGCPHCIWVETNLGRQLDEKCQLHKDIEDLQADAVLDGRIIRDVNSMLHEIVCALGGDDDDSPVALAKARMEELAEFEEQDTTPPAGIREALEVIESFIAETVDYATRNNLGDPEKQHNVKWGRKVLAALRGQS